jgi:hypothetical protein
MSMLKDWHIFSGYHIDQSSITMQAITTDNKIKQWKTFLLWELQVSTLLAYCEHSMNAISKQTLHQYNYYNTIITQIINRTLVLYLCTICI